MIVLIAALGLTAIEVQALAGSYVEVGTLQPCRLEITSRSAFVFSCPNQADVTGRVSAAGEALGFLRRVSLQELTRSDPEYQAAYEVFTREHFREHGTYPVVLPPKGPEGVLPLVPVAAPTALFLVETSERADFCAALLAGREPGPSRQGNTLFRRSGVGANAGTPWRVFCEPGREPKIEMPELDR